MRYRRLDVDGDYTFGQNTQNFVVDAEAVKQAVYTRLLLLYNEWWENVEDGLPFFQQIAGKFGTPENLNGVDLVIRERIINTEGVAQIIEYQGTFDSQNRTYSVYTKVNTIYGEFALEVTF